MKVLEKGHIYELDVRKLVLADKPLDDKQILTFVNKEGVNSHDGTTTQEVIRVLIDRTRHCNNCMPHRNNEQVVYHLRMALMLHEARALERKLEKGEYMPEYLALGEDGHFVLPTEKEVGELDTPILEPFRNDWDRECKHPKRN